MRYHQQSPVLITSGRSGLPRVANVMALITGVTLIRSISVFHLTIAYYLLTAPYQLADQNLVFIFGESMGVVSCVSDDHEKL